MQHEVCIKRLIDQLNERQGNAYVRKDELENNLNNMRVAVEACGDPDLCKFTERGIVDTTIGIFQDLKKVDEELNAINAAKDYLQLDSHVGILKG